MTKLPQPTPWLRLAPLGWAVAVIVSAGAAWRMAQPPPPPSVDPLPSPLPRPPTPEERSDLEAMGAELARAIAAASERRGGLLPISEYEALDPSGAPWLPDGLPDNPLTPAVAWVWEGCEPQPTPVPPPDWLVCSKTATLRAGGLDHPPSWSLRSETEATPTHQGSGKP